LEVALNTWIVKSNRFSWDANWSYSTSTDKITNLSGDLEKNISGRDGQVLGKPVNIYYDYEADGCWGVGEFDQYKTDWQARHPGETMNYLAAYGQPGTMKIIDVNDDGQLGDEDKRIYNRSPKHIFGMGNTFTYQNLSLSVLLYARLGGYISYGLNEQLNYETANWGDLDYWTPANTGAKFPAPGAAAAVFSTYKTALTYEKADYFKIKDITLNFSLPKSILGKAGISKVNIYASMKNYFTFSKVGNYDPERGGSVNFPLAKQFVVGANFSF
jgi:hypothetical protein